MVESLCIQVSELSTTGISNTANGHHALYSTTADDNTGLGLNVLYSNTTGTNNMAIGSQAGYFTAGDDNIVIGHTGAGECSTTRIGTGQTRTFIAGIRGTTTDTANAVTVVIDSNGQFGTVSSSQRYKEDIYSMAEASEPLLSLRPVAFRYRQAFKDGTKPVQYGLIAEEVAEVFPDLVDYNENDGPETVKYRLLITLLLNELQKQASQNQEHASELTSLKTTLGKQEVELAQLQQQSSQMQELKAQVLELTQLTMQLVQNQGFESGFKTVSAVDTH